MGADTKKSVTTGTRNVNRNTGMAPKNTDCCPSFGKPLTRPEVTKAPRDTTLSGVSKSGKGGY